MLVIDNLNILFYAILGSESVVPNFSPGANVPRHLAEKKKS
jgi:hypothetical protein